MTTPKSLRAFYKYIKLVPTHSGTAEDAWKIRLKIGVQSFDLETGWSKPEAQWRKRQLAIALRNMYEAERTNSKPADPPSTT